MGKRTAKIRLTLPQKILRDAQQHGYADLLLHGRLVVGVSGGADSLALLFALLELRNEIDKGDLHVAHVEHGFRGAEGREDASFVENIARTQGLECTVHSIDVPTLAKRLHLSPEDAARLARYSFLAQLAERLDASVAVAHTANDQAETVLMGILRGAGLAGIAGMQPHTYLHFPRCIDQPEKCKGDTLTVHVLRPMLHIWRAEVEAYCHDYSLAPRTDSTNAEQTYLRNRVRLDLIPSIESEYSPQIKRHLANLADIASADDDLLGQYAEGAWQRISTYSKSENLCMLDTAQFAGLHLALQRRLVRRAFTEVAGTLDGISFMHISSVVTALGCGAQNVPASHLPNNISVEVVAGNGIISRRSDTDKLKRSEVPVNYEWPLIADEAKIPLVIGEIILEGGWSVRREILSSGEIKDAPGKLIAHFDLSALSNLGPLILRPRRPGDTIQPIGMTGRKSLQDLYVDAKIPMLLRDSLAVLAMPERNEVLWVPGPGGRRSSSAVLTSDTEQVFQLTFTRKMAL